MAPAAHGIFERPLWIFPAVFVAHRAVAQEGEVAPDPVVPVLGFAVLIIILALGVLLLLLLLLRPVLGDVLARVLLVGQPDARGAVAGGLETHNLSSMLVCHD